MKKQKNENVSYLSEVLDKLKEHKMAMAGLVVLIVEILMVVFLPMILKLDPYTSDYTAFSAAPGGAHILGTDAIGRDVFARLMYGGRTSLLVGFVSTLISCAIGVPLGLVAGYARGKAEAVIMRIADIYVFSINCTDPGTGCSSWTVCLVCNLCHWCARLDTVCQTDLCKCTFRIRERICRICKGNWYLQFQDRDKVCSSKLFCPDPDRNHIPDGECHPF
jgi:hypothetical protein